MSLTIYGVLRSRATRCVWLALELGISFKRVPVIQSYRLDDPLAADAPLNTATPSYAAMAKGGLIPVIEDDGFILSESLAINLYLARKHGGPLAARDIREEAEMTAWSLWAAADCETHTLAVLQNRTGYAPERRSEAAAQAAVEALGRQFQRLGAALDAGGGHLVGGRFTVADINVAEVFRYALAAPELFESNPSVTAWLGRCHERPAFRAMMDERNAEPA